MGRIVEATEVESETAMLVLARRLWEAADIVERLMAERAQEAAELTRAWKGPTSQALVERLDAEQVSARSVVEALRAEAVMWAGRWSTDTGSPPAQPPRFDPAPIAR